MKFLQKSLAFFVGTEYDYRDGRSVPKVLREENCTVDQQTG